jgi:cation diffusion facilitator family transporter
MASGSTGVVIKALFANGGIAISKFVVALISGSAAMLAEAMHSTADMGNQILLLLGLKRSRRAEDLRHEFGYGTERYFWAFIVAVSLFTMGATFSIYEGIHKIGERGEAKVGNPLWAYIVLGVSIVLELYSMHAAYVEFKHMRKGRGFWRTLDEARDPVIVVVLFEDGAALVGLTLALIGVWLASVTQDVLWDGLASIAVGITLALVAGYLAKKTKRLLIGEAVTAEDRRKIVEIVESTPGIRKLIHLRTMHMSADDVIVAMKVAFDDNATVVDITRAVDECERRLRAALPYLKRIYIEAGTVSAPASGTEAPAQG